MSKSTLDKSTLRVLALSLAGSVLVSGCSVLEPDDPKPDYRSASTLPPLEVPPGLNRRGGKGTLSVPAGSDSDATTLSTYQNQRTGTVNAQNVPTQVLPTYDDMRIVRSGNQRWLEVNGDAAQLWPRITDFWLKDRIRLVTENPTSGVMETDWLENYAEINTVLRRWFRRALGSIVTADSYDKFRVRLESGQAPGTTEIYLAHRRIDAEELPRQIDTEVVATRWVQGQSDPDLEAEMLRLMMMHLGLEEEQARVAAEEQATTRPDRARLDTISGVPQIVMDDKPADAWRRVGIALDRVGFTIEDRNRASGTYFVRTIDPERAQRAASANWVSRILRRDGGDNVEQRSRLQLAPSGSGTTVSITGDGDAAPDEAAARRILSLLLEELR